MTKKFSSALLTIVLVITLLLNSIAPTIYAASSKASKTVSTSTVVSSGDIKVDRYLATRKALKIKKQPKSVTVPSGSTAKVMWSAPGSTAMFTSEWQDGIDTSNADLMAAYELDRCEDCMKKDLSSNNNDLDIISLLQNTNTATANKVAKEEPVKFTVKATKGSKTVTLKWDKVEGANKYKVYKYNSKTKRYEYLETTTKVKYKVSKLKTATTYKFLVKAYSKNGKTEVGVSNKYSVKTKPSTPTVTAKSKSKGTVTISWSKSNNVKGYQVYYSSSKNGKYKKLGSYTSTKKTAKFKSGKTYYIKVRSYYKTSGKATYSSFSEPKKVKVK